LQAAKVILSDVIKANIFTKRLYLILNINIPCRGRIDEQSVEENVCNRRLVCKTASAGKAKFKII
jgi:hypothetical protein